jgi:fluoroacetyl-CoA thioesterase
MQELKPGLSAEMDIIVEERHTAAAFKGERLAPVLSTPYLIALMEGAAHKAIFPCLKEGQSSVGSMVHVRHLAATPLGMAVRVRAELQEVDGRRLLFNVEAWDAVEKIGEGQHERFIIDQERFLARTEGKAAQGRV